MQKMATRESVLQYVRENFGTEPDQPFSNDFDSTVLRHQGSRKWYGLIMHISRQLLGLSSGEMTDILNVKLDPDLVASLVAKTGYFRAYHMNKTHWLTVLLDGSVPCEEVEQLLDFSFSLTGVKGKHH